MQHLLFDNYYFINYLRETTGAFDQLDEYLFSAARQMINHHGYRSSYAIDKEHQHKLFLMYKSLRAHNTLYKLRHAYRNAMSPPILHYQDYKWLVKFRRMSSLTYTTGLMDILIRFIAPTIRIYDNLNHFNVSEIYKVTDALKLSMYELSYLSGQATIKPHIFKSCTPNLSEGKVREYQELGLNQSEVASIIFPDVRIPISTFAPYPYQRDSQRTDYYPAVCHTLMWHPFDEHKNLFNSDDFTDDFMLSHGSTTYRVPTDYPSLESIAHIRNVLCPIIMLPQELSEKFPVGRRRSLFELISNDKIYDALINGNLSVIEFSHILGLHVQQFLGAFLLPNEFCIQFKKTIEINDYLMDETPKIYKDARANKAIHSVSRYLYATGELSNRLSKLLDLLSYELPDVREILASNSKIPKAAVYYVYNKILKTNNPTVHEQYCRKIRQQNLFLTKYIN